MLVGLISFVLGVCVGFCIMPVAIACALKAEV